jgi:hypothetical protein
MKRLSLIAVLAVLATAMMASVLPAPAIAATSCLPKSMNGTSCKPFLNRTQTVRAARAILVTNGFHSMGLRLIVASPTRIHYSGVQDGYRTWGDIFKVGDRRLWFTFETYDDGYSHVFRISFVA